MSRFGHLLNRSYWRKRAYRFSTRFLIRPSIALRRIPIVAVTGTNGKTAVVLLVNRILRDAGHRTGAACTEGVMVDGAWVMRGDHSGAKGLWRASRRFGIDAVVAETARGGILKNGLGFFRCHVSVVTNVTADHLGLSGVNTVEDLARVKSTVPRHTRRDGTAVLNFDQPLVRAMAKVSPAKVVYFSLGTPPESASDCFFVRDGTIVRRRGTEEVPMMPADRIYLTHGGNVTFQVANAMAALAVIESLQPLLPVPATSLAKSLAEFGRDPSDLPSRFQLFRYKGLDVLLSSSKNPETYAQETRLLRRLATAHGYRRVACILSNVGNRQECHYREVSRLVGDLADVVICAPPTAKYLRGRTGDEIVALLSSEIPPEKCLHVDEVSLATIAAKVTREGEGPTLFVVFATSVHKREAMADILAHGEPLPMRFDA